MENEFGEEFNKKDLDRFTGRIRRLLDKEIDKLWSNIGFTVEDREEDMKALSRYHLAEIREKGESATVYNLLMESRLNLVEENLREIEEEHDELLKKGREKLGLTE